MPTFSCRRNSVSISGEELKRYSGIAATRLALKAGSDRERRIHLRLVAARGVSCKIDVLDFFGDGGIGGVACRFAPVT